MGDVDSLLLSYSILQRLLRDAGLRKGLPFFGGGALVLKKYLLAVRQRMILGRGEVKEVLEGKLSGLLRTGQVEESAKIFLTGREKKNISTNAGTLVDLVARRGFLFWVPYSFNKT